LIGKVEQSFAERLANLLVVLNGKMCSASGADFGAAHRSLHGVTVLHAHRPHNHPARTFLSLLDMEFAILERELEPKNDIADVTIIMLI